MPATAEQVEIDLATTIDLLDVFAGKWAVVVLNDDVTTFDTVIVALVELFAHTREAAESLAWTVHRTGRAVVAVGTREEADDGVRGLARYKITALVEPVR